MTVDHYSDWFEVDLLNDDVTAANVILLRHTLPVMAFQKNFCPTMGPSMSLKSSQILLRLTVSSWLPGHRTTLKPPVKQNLLLKKRC